MNRRSLLLGTGTLAVMATRRDSRAEAPRPSTYEAAVGQAWRPIDPNGGVRVMPMSA